jgi:hypothetical protein
MNALSHGRSASWDLRRPSCRTPVRPFGSSRAPIRIHRGTGQGPGRALVTIFVDDLDRQIALSAARGLERAQHETYDNGVRKITFRDPEGAERTQLQRSSSLAAHKAAQEATTEAARDAARAAGHAAAAAYLHPLAESHQVKHILGAAAHAARAAELAAGGIGVWVLRDSSRLASERRFARRPRAIPCHS